MAANIWSSTGSTDGNAVGNWSLGALSADDTLTFSDASVVNCTLTAAWTCAALSVSTGYTGTLNLAGYAVGCGDCTLNIGTGGTINLSSSTITCSGNFDWSGAAGTVTRGTSTVVMTGTGKTLKAAYSASPLRTLYALTTQTGASVTVPNTVATVLCYGLVTVNGALTDNTTAQFQCLGGITQGVAGTVDGTGNVFYLSGGTLTFANPSAIAPATIRILGNLSLPPGTYSPMTLFDIYGYGNQTFTWQAGTYTFTSPVFIGQRIAGTFTVTATNNPTLIFQSNVTVVQITGTTAFTETNHTNPNQLTGTANQTLSLAAKNMGTWVLNKPSAGTVTFTSGDSIVAGGAWSMTALTEPAGVSIDLGDGGWSHAVSGDVPLDGTAFDMGNCTLTVGGSYDCQHVTTFTRGTGTLVMTGASKTLTQTTTNYVYNLTISDTANITHGSVSSYLASNSFTLNGSLSVPVGVTAYFYTTCSTTLGSSAVLTGSGGAVVYGASGKGITSVAVGAVIDIATLTAIFSNFAAILAPATYGSATVTFVNSGATSCTWTPSATPTIPYTFAGNVIYKNDNASSVMTINCAANNPNITIGGSLTFTQFAGTLTYTKGTGTLTLNSATAATLNTLGQAVEDIVIAKAATANTVTLGSNIVTDSFTLTTGTLVPSGKNITTTGNLTIGIAGQVSAATLAGCVWTVGGDFSATGELGDLLTLNPSSDWTLNVTGSATASYVNVAYSDASGGSTVVAANSTNSGNNTNWTFSAICFSWLYREHEMDIKADTTSVTKARFSAWTTLTGAAVAVTAATAGLALWYKRDGGSKVLLDSLNNLAAEDSVYNTQGIKQIGGQKHRLDLPNAAFAAGATSVEWGGEATGITILGGEANLIGQANTATDLSHVGGNPAPGTEVVP